MAISMPTKVDEDVLSLYYPWVQGKKHAGKWLVMAFDVGEKTATAKMTKFACSKGAFDKKKGKTKKKYVEAQKSLDDSKEGADWLMVDDAPDAEAADDPLKKIAKGHYDVFVDAMAKVAHGDKGTGKKATGQPAVGVIEMFTKVFYVTYCSDDYAKQKLKMAFSSCRENIKTTLSTTNCDVQATDMDDMAFEAFEKQAPKI